ncbi:MAG: DUF2911 domain-containing protein [Gemmatimonadaceae bacterium]
MQILSRSLSSLLSLSLSLSLVVSLTLAAGGCAGAPAAAEPPTPEPASRPAPARGEPAARPPSQPPSAPAASRRDSAPPTREVAEIASPRDSAELSVGGARVSVNYGRPSMRGRTIFGGLVPYGQIWRTGANAATAFTTTRDLVMGDVNVPAGSYTLYTIVRPAASPSCDTNAEVALARAEELPLLVISRQTGQWGTEYHSEQDVARIPMMACGSSTLVERFEITLVPAGTDAGALRLSWERTRFTVPFQVKR